jgi:hypothetical protein
MRPPPDEERPPPKENAGRQPGAFQSSITTTDKPTAAPRDPQPEYRSSRRRFLIYAVMAGFAPPERLTERIIAEIEATP